MVLNQKLKLEPWMFILRLMFLAATGKWIRYAMKSQSDDVMSYDSEEFNDNAVKLDRKIVNHVLDNTTRDDDGRLCIPLL